MVAESSLLFRFTAQELFLIDVYLLAPQLLFCHLIVSFCQSTATITTGNPFHAKMLLSKRFCNDVFSIWAQ